MRTKNWPQLLGVGFALLSAIVAVGSAQTTRPKIPPPDFKRESAPDAAGLKQWKPFDVDCPQCKGTKNFTCEHCKDTKFPTCLECDGSKRAPCRLCCGKGKLPDPLVEQQCPYCWGSSWYPCELCNGWGFMKIDGADTKCGACKQKGLVKCIACGGQRHTESAKVGKQGVGEASAKDLRELLVRLRAAQAALDKFEPDANVSKSSKAFVKLLEPIEKDLKVVKDMEKMLDESLKGVKSYGAGYSGYEEHLLAQFLTFKDRTVFLLQYQVRAAEQSLERAEFNESKPK
jgi:hypothetical protein